MKKEFLYFTLGSLFTLCLSTNSALMHFVSIFSLYLFCFILFRKKQKGMQNINMDIFHLKLLTIHEILTGVFIIIMEYFIQKWVPFFRWAFIRRAGAVMLVSGLLLSIASMCTFDLIGVSKRGPFAYMRLPLVLGFDMLVFGSLIYIGDYITITIFGYFHFSTLNPRINNMEAIRAKASEEYKKYIEEVPSGIPFIK
ncbi:Protein-S-isoprenylcysteine O-methyltransferase [Astathelohania contejeani]|uniref:Protein-S-isoprenylcysteine O-methyltransferase n=1 Tax=Astathelohania contejeani TaxID=164912 RepID=A0ABQ7HZJ2_9MICR|nr:Protein-S-isoprenylcysteine O-methyltransferase [Thelohania contejeani]